MLLITTTFGNLFGIIETVKADVGDILFSFDTPDDFEAFGLTIYEGKIVAGGYSSEGTPPYNQQVRFFSQQGDELESLCFDFNHEGEITGITHDGTYLWILNRQSDGISKVYKYTATGVELTHLTIPDGFDSVPAGLSYYNDYLFYSTCWDIAGFYQCIINTLALNGTVVNAYFAPDLESTGSYYQGLANDNNYRWYTKNNVYEYWKLGPGSSFSFEQNSISNTRDLGWDGQYLWVAGNSGETIYKLDITPNDPPNKPSKPQGPAKIGAGTSKQYSTSATDPEGDQVQYRFNWGDGETSDWSSLVDSGTSVTMSHTWDDPGNYEIKSQAKDSNGEKSVWSDTLAIEVVGVCAGGPYYGFKNYYIQFTGSVSQGTPPYTWKWDFNNDGTIDSNQQNPKYTYSSTYNGKAKLTVTDASGTTTSDTASVSVKNLRPVADTLITLSGTDPSWDGSHLSATVPFNKNAISDLINLDGSVPGSISIGDFSGPYDFGIDWDNTKIKIDLYPEHPDNDKMVLQSGVELSLEAYNDYGSGGSFSCGANGSFEILGDDFDWDLRLYLQGKVVFPVLRVYGAAGPIPISAAADLYLDGDLNFYLNSPDDFDDNVFDHMTGSLGVGGKARGGIGFVGLASAGLYGGIDGRWHFKAPETSGSVYDSFVVTISFGAYAEIIFLGYWEWEWYSYSWPNAIGKNPKNNGFQFMQRDYGTPAWINNESGVLLDNAFPASSPSISSNSNNDKIMVWAQDDLSISGSGGNNGDGLEIWYSTWNKNTEEWNTPGQITNDNYAQSNPSVTLLENGDAICVYNSLGTTAAGKTLQQIFSDSEIRYSYWNGNSWTSPQLVVNGGTTSNYMDSYPVIKSDGNNAVVTWICDDDADIFSVNNQKDIYTSFYEGNSWTGTRTISSKNIVSAQVSLAYNNGEASIAYAVDEDGFSQTADDQNIYITTFSNSARDDTTTQITSNGRNGHPSVNYISGTNPSVSWVEEETNPNEDLETTIYYMSDITKRDVEIVEDGIESVSSAPMFSCSGSKDNSFPLIGWNDGNNICFKRRFDTGWENKVVLHSSDKKITQPGWDYNGTGVEVSAIFVEKEDLNESQNCQLKIAGKGNLLIPEKPTRPAGPTEGYIYEKYTFESSAIDPTPYNELYYNWSWDDGTYDIYGPYSNGEVCRVDHRWDIIKKCIVKVQVINYFGESQWSEELEIDIKSAPPSKPKISGPKKGIPGEVYHFSIYSNDPDKQDTEYFIDWGDGDVSGWIGPYETGESIIIGKFWKTMGTYVIRVKARDSVHHGESEWTTHEIVIPKTKNHEVGRSAIIQYLQDFIKHFPILEKIFSIFLRIL